MGKGGAVTIGYREDMGLHMGFCRGPVDALLEITGDKKSAWKGEQTTSGTISINKPDLYGGEKKEGGLVGTFEVMMGDADQPTNAYLTQVQGGLQSAYRSLFTGVYRGEVGAITPYVKNIGVRVRRALKGWYADDCWEPTLAQVGRGMNGVHIIVEALTDPEIGAGMTRSADLDLDNFRAAAQQCYDEDLGLCLGWRRSTPVDTFIGTVCDHIGAMMTEDPETLKQQIVLVRGGYDIDDLVHIDESNIISLTRFQQTLLASTINEVIVKYHDVETDTDANTPPAQNLANMQAQGCRVSQTTEYTGFWKGDQANRAAQRDCQAKSCLPAAVEVIVKSSLWRIKRGDVIAFSWKRKGIVKMALRVLEVGRGDRPNRPITLTCVQDTFGLPSTTYIATQPSMWVPPDTTPHPLPAQQLVEASYRDLAHRLRSADLQALGGEAGYLIALGARPTGVAHNFDLVARLSPDDFSAACTGDFAPCGLLALAIDPMSTDIVLTAGTNLDLVRIGKAALLDDEVVRIDTIDPQTGAVTIGRACADTVRAPHELGARLWIYEDHAGYSTTEYVAGETIDAKFLTRTGQGVLSVDDAPTSSLTMAERQARPYPPADDTINGDPWYSTSSAEGELSLAWHHRDRLLQADQLVDALQGDIGPEPGTTYTVRFIDAGDDSLLSETTGIDGNTFMATLSFSGQLRIEVVAVRDELESWQALSTTLEYLAAPPGDRITDDGSYRATDDGSRRITE